MFNYFDVIVAALMIAGGYFGFQTGGAASLFYMGSGFAGIWTAHRFAHTPGVKYVLFFVAGAGAVILAGFILSRIFKGLVLGMIDRLAGVLIGILLAALIASLAVMGDSPRIPSSLRKTMRTSWYGAHIIPEIELNLLRVQHLNVARARQAFRQTNPFSAKK
ncbi:MAG: hypothetical protein A2219_02110 [Elusimicrobia bacterium RIFOXYA2_FULL_50_26]|nr:MAG: hypothetical protein A2219_02110 [Elusimicrobia bacterium RIFOXYA2_FULL_50_26]OGS23498.1 MAG: hypothetical protein A2314_05580 [Elusimicrobia bacterium RIFOXYB2_FULL_50_12]